jgi:predicted DCC family thiol-disulfide oxidoreductase YuxK
MFIIRRDKKNLFCFASFQSATGKKLAQIHKLPPSMESIALIERDRCHIKSSAVLRIVRQLPGLWPCLGIFLLVPVFIRDAVYDLIAKNRYRWFGQKDQCMMPTPDILARFL